MFILQIFIVTVSIMVQTSPQSESWLQYGGVGRNFVLPIDGDKDDLSIVWRQSLGLGTSGIVSDGKLFYTMYIRLKDGSKVEGEEIISAREVQSGKIVWEKGTSVKSLKGQESFSGDPIRPQATPALHRGSLCTLGYTGLLCGWEANSGKLLWQYDLVKEMGAKPVQFGFSSSPLIYQDDFVVHVGGSQAVLIRLDAHTGKILWKSEAGEPSYSSPIVARFDENQQLVQVTRDAILGIDPDTGKTLWMYAMPEAGLTNVPTPLLINDNKLLISGQGVKGTRLLQISKSSEKWVIKEIWHNNKVTFFYCNWQISGGAVYGNANKILLGLNLDDGKELWRERGFTESNLLQIGAEHFLLDGNGRLTKCRLSTTGVKKNVSQNVLSMRCWTAPTPVGDILLMRDQTEIVAVRWAERRK